MRSDNINTYTDVGTEYLFLSTSVRPRVAVGISSQVGSQTEMDASRTIANLIEHLDSSQLCNRWFLSLEEAHLVNLMINLLMYHL